MKIYHIERDLQKKLEVQKKELKRKYKNFCYMFSDGRHIHFMAD